MYQIIRRFLFFFDAERVHYFAMNSLHLILKIPFSKYLFNKIFDLSNSKLERTVFGIKFKNPVGLAAGFDKNATMFSDLSCLGFGFIEVGTVTPKAQDGNEKPRLFRPNTPNLRALQDKEPLTNLLSELQSLNNNKPNPKPILLKIAPDLSNDQLDDIIQIVQETKIAGIIATNTTINRENLTTDPKEVESLGPGGISGKPLNDRSTEVIRYLHSKSNGAFPIIGVGGIHSPGDAIEKLKAGASLIQLYTGFIYEGPSLIRKINKAIIKEGLYE